MNEAEAFERAMTLASLPDWQMRHGFRVGWQAACEWKDTQVPAAQINQRLLEALQFVIDCQESTNGSDYQSGSALREAASMAKAALAAAKK